MPASLLNTGLELLAEQKRDLRGETVIDGVKPRRGWWVIHRTRRRVYGVILEVRRSGHVQLLGPNGAKPVIAGRTLVDGGYSYISHAQRVGIEWPLAEAAS